MFARCHLGQHNRDGPTLPVLNHRFVLTRTCFMPQVGPGHCPSRLKLALLAEQADLVEESLGWDVRVNENRQLLHFSYPVQPIMLGSPLKDHQRGEDVAVVSRTCSQPQVTQISTNHASQDYSNSTVTEDTASGLSLTSSMIMCSNFIC